MKILKISLFVLVLTLAAGTAMAQTSKVGFINPQRVVLESRIGKSAQADLARLGEEKDRIIQIKRKQVEDMRIAFEAGAYSATEATSREKNLRIAIREFDQLVENSTSDLQGEERRLIKFVMRRADIVLRRLAQEQGFTMILTDPEAIGYVADSMDLTDRVIRELDAMK